MNGIHFFLCPCMTPCPAHRVTNETYRFITDARFHPSGTKVIATKWYTSSRSIPAGEGWQYEVPSIPDLRQGNQNLEYPIRAGSGKRVIARTLPIGWSPEQYGDQQIGKEQFIWHGVDTVIYSKKTHQEPSGIFEYSNGERISFMSSFPLSDVKSDSRRSLWHLWNLLSKPH